MFGETNGMTARAEHQFAGGILDSVDAATVPVNGNDLHLSGQDRPGEHTAVGTGHGRSVGFGFARLPYRRRPVPGSKDAECDGQ